MGDYNSYLVKGIAPGRETEKPAPGVNSKTAMWLVKIWLIFVGRGGTFEFLRGGRLRDGRRTRDKRRRGIVVSY